MWHNAHRMNYRLPKDAEIRARIDGRTKAELSHLAFDRDLQISDLLREAVRDLLRRQQRAHHHSKGMSYGKV